MVVTGQAFQPPPTEPLIVTLDVGSSSVRALCFDAAGRVLPVGRQLRYEQDTTPDGGVEVDAERLLALTADALGGLLADLDDRAGAVAGVGISTFWQGTFVGSFIIVAVLFDRLRARSAND